MEGVLGDLSEEERRGIIAEFLSEAKDQHLSALNQLLLQAEEAVKSNSEMPPEDLNAMFRSAHTIKGTASFIGFKKIVDLTHEMETLLQKVRNREFGLTGELIQLLFEAFDMLECLFAGLERQGRETGDINGVVARIGSYLAALQSAPGAPATAAAAQPAVEQREPVAGKEPAEKSDSIHKPAGESQVIRIDTRKVDSLMNLAGELVVLRARFDRMVGMLQHSLSCRRTPGRGEDEQDLHALDEINSLFGRLAGDIQSGIMQVRMIPLEGLFSKYKRIVRDIARDINKEALLRIEGQETELDKKIVDALTDPLTHMIRNAIDHGLEDAATRRQAGKPAAGTITLKAAHKGGSIWIEVGDDGRGLDAEKVAQVAAQKGLVAEDRVRTMSEREKMEFIFLPGFSTARQVTGISGRGVGMDVVRTMIASVNGTVDIETTPGRGTTFILKIPLTLSVIQGLLVALGGERYCLPLESVAEIIRLSPEKVSTVNGVHTLRLRESLLSIVSPKHILGRETAVASRASGCPIVVITDGAKRIGLPVDRVIGESQFVVKPLPAYCAGIGGISGASILGDGSVALILDPGAILRQPMGQQ